MWPASKCLVFCGCRSISLARKGSPMRQRKITREQPRRLSLCIEGSNNSTLKHFTATSTLLSLRQASICFLFTFWRSHASYCHATILGKQSPPADSLTARTSTEDDHWSNVLITETPRSLHLLSDQTVESSSWRTSDSHGAWERRTGVVSRKCLQPTHPLIASRGSLQEGDHFLGGRYTKKGRKTRIVRMMAVQSWRCPVPPAAPMDQDLRDPRTDRKCRLRTQGRTEITWACR